MSANPSTVTQFFCSNSTKKFVLTFSQFSRNHEIVTVPNKTYCYVDSNHPVLLLQFSSGHNADNTDSDPFMMSVSPVKHYFSDYVVIVPPEFPQSVIAIFVLPEYYQPEKIHVDGVNQVDANWTSIPCANETICGHFTYVSATIGQHVIYHEHYFARMAVSIYGFSYYNGYGYYMLELDGFHPKANTTSTSAGTEIIPSFPTQGTFVL